MSHSIVDRRSNAGGKSSVNRRKFIEKVKDLLKDGIKDIIRDTNLKDLVGKGGKKVKIPNGGLGEPWFHSDGGGINDMVRPGNDRYFTGDRISRPKSGSGSGGSQGSEDGEGEDTFSFHLTKEEFLDLFFENCRLPDMVKRNLALIEESVKQRAGFTSSGSQAAMNITRSMRGATSRRSGLRAVKTKKLQILIEQEQLLVLKLLAQEQINGDITTLLSDLATVRDKIVVLERKIKAVPFIDPIDLKFNNWDTVKIPTVQAVIFCLMDVSGSMQERHKELAKTVFLLLYLFLQKGYDRIEVEYIRYHSSAKRVDEHTFYYGHDTGGTMTSRGLQMVYDIILSDYPTEMWNIYLAHASDGDNFTSDNEIVKDLILNKLLPVLQYYAYIQINPVSEHSYGGDPREDPSNLWNVISPMVESRPNLAHGLVTDETEVYPVFIKLFERK